MGFTVFQISTEISLLLPQHYIIINSYSMPILIKQLLLTICFYFNSLLIKNTTRSHRPTKVPQHKLTRDTCSSRNNSYRDNTNKDNSNIKIKINHSNNNRNNSNNMTNNPRKTNPPLS